MSKTLRDDTDRFFQYNIDIRTRTLYMGSASDSEGDESGTDYEMAQYVIKGLHILESQTTNADKPITIIMNNVGGNEYHGLGIYDAILCCKNHVTIRVFGHAMSMGGIILQAADERIMAPNSRFMMHYGTFSIEANAKDAYKWVEDNKKIDKFMEELFLKQIKTKKPRFTMKQLQEMLKSDYIADAKTAVEYGLADKIMGE